MTTIDEILKFDDLHRVTVTIPEWNNAHITVASMTALERAEIERRWAKKEAGADPAAFRADILERSLKNADGSPLASKEQIGALMGKNANAMGGSPRATGTTVTVLSGTKAPSLIRLRRDFIQEILKTAEDL